MVDEELLRRDFESMLIPAELHPELVPYLTRNEHFEMLRHPLVFGVPYNSEMNNHYNKQYELMRGEVIKALEAGKVHTFVFLHERPHRLDAFSELIATRVVGDTDYWELLGSIWIDSENVWQNFAIWKHLLKSKRPNRHLFMDEEDREAFKKLPRRLTVYRGCVRGQNENGMSWTLDKNKATWFSSRLVNRNMGERRCVLEKTVNKSKVFAYLTGRGESEIIIL